MNPERTELEWIYEPADFFERSYRHAYADYDVLVESGRALATLRVPQDPVNPELGDRIAAQVADLFLLQQLNVHRTYDLQGPRVYQHAEGRKNVAIRVGSAAVVADVGQPDIIVRNAAGNIVQDTKAERMAEHTSVLVSVAPKLAQSSILRSLLRSYSRSVTDPANEFVHLYEIRDTLSKHYRGEQMARAALNISKGEWKRLGLLANVEPLEQGRHRGEHPAGRRVATVAELEEARGILRRWILAFAETV